MTLLAYLARTWRLWRYPDYDDFPVVKTSIAFLKNLKLYSKEKPFRLDFPADSIPGAYNTNIEREVRDVLVRDIRGHEECFSIETTGFEIVKHSTKLQPSDFSDKATLESVYLPEVERLLRSRFEVTKVVFIGWTLRNNSQDGSHAPGSLLPITYAHIDQTQGAVKRRVEHHIGKKEASDILRRHKVMVINVWRSLVEPLEDMPLAVADRRFVRQDDCIALDSVKSDGYVGEEIIMRYHEEQRFYYLSQQRQEEVWLLFMGGYDPKHPSDPMTGTPHAAFPLPRCGEQPSPRLSVEVRAIVVS